MEHYTALVLTVHCPFVSRGEGRALDNNQSSDTNLLLVRLLPQTVKCAPAFTALPTWRLQQVRVDGGVGECGGRGQAGQLVDRRGRARGGGARAAHVRAETVMFR